VGSVGDDVSRTEKVAAIVEREIDSSALSFCRQAGWMPDNCGVCAKCIRTKAMFLVVTGAVPDIFANKSLDKGLMQSLSVKGHERPHIFDLYFYAKERGLLNTVPGLLELVDHYRGIEF